MVQSLLKIGLQFLKKLFGELLRHLLLHPSYIPKRTDYVCTEAVMGVFKVVLFMIVKMHKQPKYLSVAEWIIKKVIHMIGK